MQVFVAFPAIIICLWSWFTSMSSLSYATSGYAFSSPAILLPSPFTVPQGVTRGKISPWMASIGADRWANRLSSVLLHLKLTLTWFFTRSTPDWWHTPEIWKTALVNIFWENPLRIAHLFHIQEFSSTVRYNILMKSPLMGGSLWIVQITWLFLQLSTIAFGSGKPSAWGSMSGVYWLLYSWLSRP